MDALHPDVSALYFLSTNCFKVVAGCIREGFLFSGSEIAPSASTNPL